MIVRQDSEAATTEPAANDVGMLVGVFVALMLLVFIFALSLGAVLLVSMLRF